MDTRERRILVWGSAAIFVSGWADVSVKNVSETLFLKRIGVDYLPVAFLANAFLLMATTSVFGALASRVDPLRLFTRTLVALAALLALLSGALRIGGDALYPVLLMASKQIGTLSLIAFSGAMAALIDPRKAKRLLPPLLAGNTLGEILGSFASGPLGRRLDVEGLLPMAAILLLLGATATLPLRRLPAAHLVLERRRPRGRGTGPGRAKDAAIPSALSLWRESWLFRALTLSALLCGAVGPMLYFQFSYVANLATQGAGGEEKLLALYGVVRGWLQVGVLGAQLWVAPALYRHLGVPLAGVFSPLLYLLGFGGLTLRLGLPEGVAALSAATVQDQAVHDPAQRLLAALFPERVSARVTALVEGTAKRAGGCLGNLLVLAAIGLGNVHSVGIVGIPVALSWFAVTLRIWRAYPSLMLDLATKGRRLSKPGSAGAELLDAGTMRSLARTLSDPDATRGRAALDLLRDLRPSAAGALLTEALPSCNEGLRPVVIETLESLVDDAPAGRGGASLAAFLQQSPPDDAAQRASLVRILAKLQDPAAPDAEAIARIERLAADPSPAVALAAALGLHRLGRSPEDGRALQERLSDALGGTDAAMRRLAFRELRALLRDGAADGDPAPEGEGAHFDVRLALLQSGLASADTRAEAARAMADVAARVGARACAAREAMLALADDADPSVRASVLRFVGFAKLGDRAHLLAQRLASTDEEEAEAAAAGLHALGPESLDVLLQELSVGRRSVRDAIVPFLRELSVDPGLFRAQLRRELEGVAERLLELGALRDEDFVAPLLLQRLEERAQGGLHTAFLLLAALHDDDRIVALGDALRRPQSAHARALRVEALEGLLSPAERALLLPFVEDPRPEVRSAAAERLLGRGPKPWEETVAALQSGGDALTRTLLEASLRPPGGRNDDEPGDPTLGEADLLEKLRAFRIFEHLSVRQLADVAMLARQEVVPSGVDIVREGESENDIFALVEGRVKVSKSGIALSVLGNGEIFGELSLFDGEPRSATVTTLEPTRVIRIEGRDLLALLEELPAIAIGICRSLSVLVRTLTARAGR